jgi:hypothetical protein
MQPYRMTRRRLFVTGSGVLGLAIVNTVSGCSPAQDDSAAPAPTSAGPAIAWRRVSLSFVSA